MATQVTTIKQAGLIAWIFLESDCPFTQALGLQSVACCEFIAKAAETQVGIYESPKMGIASLISGQAFVNEPRVISMSSKASEMAISVYKERLRILATTPTPTESLWS
jgi:hypothetical protein